MAFTILLLNDVYGFILFYNLQLERLIEIAALERN